MGRVYWIALTIKPTRAVYAKRLAMPAVIFTIASSSCVRFGQAPCFGNVGEFHPFCAKLNFVMPFGLPCSSSGAFSNSLFFTWSSSKSFFTWSNCMTLMQVCRTASGRARGVPWRSRRGSSVPPGSPGFSLPAVVSRSLSTVRILTRTGMQIMMTSATRAVAGMAMSVALPVMAALTVAQVMSPVMRAA